MGPAEKMLMCKWFKNAFKARVFIETNLAVTKSSPLYHLFHEGCVSFRPQLTGKKGGKVTFVMHMGCDTVMSTPTLKIANRENRNQQPNILKNTHNTWENPNKQPWITFQDEKWPKRPLPFFVCICFINFIGVIGFLSDCVEIFTGKWAMYINLSNDTPTLFKDFLS